jgi:hypothetical protein
MLMSRKDLRERQGKTIKEELAKAERNVRIWRGQLEKLRELVRRETAEEARDDAEDGQ